MRKCSSVDKENLSVFPEEILSEILSWLEAKYLLRYKCVCKVWYSVIRSKLLVDMHALRNGSLHSDWIQEKNHFNCKYCRGLLLEQITSLSPAIATHRLRNPTNCWIASPPTYRIRNPTTKCMLNLPSPQKGARYMDLFQYPSTSSYYVVLLSFDVVKKKYNLALLDLGGQSNDPCPSADLSWRILNIPVFDMLISRQERYHFSCCMSSEGILHILCLPVVGLNIPEIICVDLVKQTCQILKMPKNLYFNYKQLKFQSWIGKPSVVFVREKKLNIWVLEDYKKQKWADTMVIPLPSLRQLPNLTTGVPHIHRDNGDEEDILIYTPVNWPCYTVKSGSVVTYQLPDMRVPATLVSLKGMQPGKKEC